MNERLRQAYLEAMGIQAWELRGAGARQPAGVVAEATSVPASANVPEVGGAADLDWQALQDQALACTRCQLHTTRTQVVFGVGDPEADLMLIGEAPGADEDRQGEPFVGRAGRLLNEMLAAIGLGRERVYIANILKCRPPRNRDPEPDEVASCEPYLQRQVELVRPRLVLALGRVAAHNLLKTQVSLGRLRNQHHAYGAAEVPVIVTYHPAYLLRNPLDKRKAWSDLRMARQMLEGRERAS